MYEVIIETVRPWNWISFTAATLKMRLNELS